MAGIYYAAARTRGGGRSLLPLRAQPEPEKPMDVQLFDTTLRDGTQSEGLSLSVEDKLKIARLLDGFGIHFIEGGYPGSNPKDVEFFRRARALRLQHPQLTAVGSTREAGGPAGGDADPRGPGEGAPPAG